MLNFNNPEPHDVTVEDRYQTTLKINEEERRVDILDTAGEDDFPNMLDIWIMYADGIMLIFSVRNRRSFEKVKEKRENFEVEERRTNYFGWE